MKRKHAKHSPRTQGAGAAPRAPSTAKPVSFKPDGIQGEGNYTAAREFDEAERRFVSAGRVEAAARAAAPRSEAEQQEMLAAEEEGKRRARK